MKRLADLGPVRLQLAGQDAHVVLSLQHLPEPQRCFAPLGILSCSDVCAGLLHKLAFTPDSPQAAVLEQIRVGLHYLSCLSSLSCSWPPAYPCCPCVLTVSC